MIGGFLLLCATLALCIFLVNSAKRSFEENDYFWGVLFTGLFSVNLNTSIDVLVKLLDKI
jgi:hypothetical protein